MPTPAPRDAPPWTGPQSALAAVLVAVGCWFGATFATRFVFPGAGAAILFPPYAVLAAVLLVAPTRRWWLVVAAGAAGTVLAHLGSERSASFALSAELANVARALVAAGGIRAVTRRPRLDTLPGAATFVAFAVLLGPAFGATLGAAAVVLHGKGPTFGATWQAWALSNALTGASLLPLLLALSGLRPSALRRVEPRVVLEGATLVAGLGAAGFAALVAPAGALAGPLAPYAPLPFLVWAAVRFGPGGAIAALAAVTAMALAGAMRNGGPFVGHSPDEDLLQLQLFVVATHVLVLLLAGTVAQHSRVVRALRASERRYRTVVDDQAELICRFLPDETCTFANGAFARHVGRPAGDVVGAPCWSFLPPEEAAAARALRESTTPDEPVVTFDHRGARSHQWTVRALFDDDGRVVEYQAVGRDVTERERVEDELLELASERRFRTLADHAPVLIWESGLRNEALYFNQPWLDFTGRPLEEQLGLGWIESIHPDDRARCLATCDAAFAARAPLVMQFRLRRHDGAWRWVLDNGIPNHDADGAFVGYLGSCVDITDRYLAEERLQDEARRKDEFLAMLGHELRNPLAPIGMAVAVLRRVPVVDEQTVWARDVIARQLAQLTRLVDDLLDLSRITRGTIKLAPKALRLGQIVAQAVETSRPLLESRRHTLSVELPDDPLPVDGDAVRLTQVFANLLNNAAKYTPPGGRIGVTARRDAESVEVAVTDDGVGIPEPMLERVFDMFLQLDHPGDRSQGGLGIGLTVVRRIVEMHRGTVEARSAGPGRGSTFVVRLPLREAEPRETPGPAPRAEGPSVRRRVLVVDDNVDAAESVSRALALEQHEVLVAHDGAAALSVAERVRPDVVLLDLGMPGLDGLEVARRLRRRDDRWRPLLVATTGFGLPEDRARSAAAGFDHHLVKPVDLDVLSGLVRSGRPP